MRVREVKVLQDANQLLFLLKHLVIFQLNICFETLPNKKGRIRLYQTNLRHSFKQRRTIE
jgi:hypothetical protein